jgi:hypothetical protein
MRGPRGWTHRDGGSASAGRTRGRREGTRGHGGARCTRGTRGSRCRTSSQRRRDTSEAQSGCDSRSVPLLMCMERRGTSEAPSGRDVRSAPPRPSGVRAPTLRQLPGRGVDAGPGTPVPRVLLWRSAWRNASPPERRRPWCARRRWCPRRHGPDEGPFRGGARGRAVTTGPPSSGACREQRNGTNVPAGQGHGPPEAPRARGASAGALCPREYPAPLRASRHHPACPASPRAAPQASVPT